MKTAWGDFFSPPTRGYVAIINIYWLWCLKVSVELCKKLGQDDQANRYQLIFEKALQAFEARFWVPEKGLYRDNICFDRTDKANEPTYCESTLFSLMRAGLIEKNKGLGCLKTIMAPDFVCNRTAGGLELSSLPAFLLNAGQTDSALRCYLDCWGEPVKAGATTSLEMFHRVGSSDCHIHGATPARDFLEFLAGIRIKKAGWQEILFVPPTASPLLGELRAEIPISGGGRICVEIKKAEGGKFFYSYEFPKMAKGFMKIGSVMKTLIDNKGEIEF